MLHETCRLGPTSPICQLVRKDVQLGAPTRDITTYTQRFWNDVKLCVLTGALFLDVTPDQGRRQSKHADHSLPHYVTLRPERGKTKRYDLTAVSITLRMTLNYPYTRHTSELTLDFAQHLRSPFPSPIPQIFQSEIDGKLNDWPWLSLNLRSSPKRLWTKMETLHMSSITLNLLI